jgi:hypothetical protein
MGCASERSCRVSRRRSSEAGRTACSRQVWLGLADTRAPRVDNDPRGLRGGRPAWADVELGARRAARVSHAGVLDEEGAQSGRPHAPRQTRTRCVLARSSHTAGSVSRRQEGCDGLRRDANTCIAVGLRGFRNQGRERPIRADSELPASAVSHAGDARIATLSSRADHRTGDGGARRVVMGPVRMRGPRVGVARAVMMRMVPVLTARIAGDGGHTRAITGAQNSRCHHRDGHEEHKAGPGDRHGVRLAPVLGAAQQIPHARVPRTPARLRSAGCGGGAWARRPG